jgi:isopenicillin-N epimerase
MSPDLPMHWTLDPSVVFLNHGSFGACPAVVLESQQRLRAALEREPLQFLWRDIESKLDSARFILARLLNADPEGLAFVSNATTGVNAVLRSLDVRPGDELLTTDHAYNACRNALDFVAQRSGALVVVATIPFPLRSPDQVVDAIMTKVGPRTRLALIDHITSPTALVLPIDRLVRELAARQVLTLVDGAHGPGMLPLNLQALGATWYTGNCHKWLCAPKGAGFLYVAKEQREITRPVVISHGARVPRTDRSRFRLEFDWVGTVDPTPYLCVPDSIDFLSGLLPGGLPAVLQKNHELALAARDMLCARLAVPCPAPDAMLGSMAAVPLPAPLNAIPAATLQSDLFRLHHIEVPIIPWTEGQNLVRVACQLYNDIGQIELLCDALRAIERSG